MLPKQDIVSAGLADQEAFIKIVKSLKIRNPICIEVGSFIGVTANALIKAGAEHVYCIDLWSGGPQENLNSDGKQEWNWKTDEKVGKEVLSKFCGNVSLFSKVTPIIGSSVWWSGRWPFKVDLILIDANHTYEEAYADIKCWWPHLKIGGIMCGHDYSNSCPGVIKAVDEIFSASINKSGHSVWSIRKESDLN